MTRRMFDGVCQVDNINPRILIESNSPHCLLALVKAQMGIAIVPSTVLLGQLEQNAIRICHGGRQLGFHMSVVWDTRRYISPAAKIFIEKLCLATRDNYPGKNFGYSEFAPISTQTI